MLTESGNLKDLWLAQTIFPVYASDLNGDGRIECLLLQSGAATITDCRGAILWESPNTWEVKESQITDLNQDGKPEVALIVWRPFQPWPVDLFMPSGGRINTFHDSKGLSCHVILIGWARQGFNELWAGSALIRPVSQMIPVDLDHDGDQELVVLEGEYDAGNPQGILTVWEWSGFGFRLVDNGTAEYSQISIIGNSVGNWIATLK